MAYFLTVFLAMFQGIPVSPVKIAGLALGFAGCLLLFAIRYGDTTFGGLTAEHFMAIAAAIIWALYSCFAKTKTYPTGFMVPIFLISSVIFLVLHLLLEQTVWPDIRSWGAILLLGGFRIAYVFWDYAIRQGDRLLVSSLAYFVPLISTLLLILGGYGTGRLMIGIAAVMIVTGCLIVNAQQIRDVFSKKDCKKTGQIWPVFFIHCFWLMPSNTSQIRSGAALFRTGRSLPSSIRYTLQSRPC